MSVPRLTGSVSPAASGATSTELLVLLPSLGTTTELWDGVVSAIRPALPAVRVLRVDLPGHGASPVVDEAITIGDLASGVLRLVDEVGGGRFHVAGDSLGGAIALELAVSSPDRVLSLAILASGARIGEPSGWADRASAVRGSGTASLVPGSAERWFVPGYLDRDPDGPGGHALRTLVDVDDESYARCCEALGVFDRTADAPAIAAPSLLVAGAHDRVTTSSAMRELADAMPDARFVELADAAHLPPLERPAEVATLLAWHLGSTDAATRGLAVRRAVLGDAHVDAAIAATTPETAAFQDFITRYAWGEIWARPVLGRRERSIATLASLVTGGHEAEIRMHVKAALRNGLAPDEITEVMLHTALYAGLPAANAALAIARDVFATTAPGAGSGAASDAASDADQNDQEKSHG
ncbi:MAG: alpha/beta fold hydrolase [Leifsonia sp.]